MSLVNRISSLVIVLWVIGLFLRCYRQNENLGFYYDQGRDAKIAADIISLKNFPAIGPTTGINGLYLGPFWYYLITPGYFFGSGNPAIASFFIAFLESLTIPLIYYFVSKYWRKDTALIACFLWTFSPQIIRSSRWFSNPSPLPFFVLLILILLLKVFKDKQYKLLPIISLLFGLSLQLEAASAVFFAPIFIIIALTNISDTKKINLKYWLYSFIGFFFLLIPQALFDLKNDFLISNNFLGFLTGKVNTTSGSSWAFPSLNFLTHRLYEYYHAFFARLDTNVSIYASIFLLVFFIGLILLYTKLRQNKFIQVNLIFFLVPLFILLFFVGNYQTLYEYYLTGYFPLFIILFSIVITLPKPKFIYFPLLFVFIFYFISQNYIHLYHYLTDGIDGPENVVYGNEIQAVDYLCQKNNQNSGSLDIYVPPITPHTYEYLFKWRNCHFSNSQSNLYLLYEVDPSHPERLSAWLDKYKNYVILNQKSFGGIYTRQLLRVPQ